MRYKFGLSSQSTNRRNTQKRKPKTGVSSKRATGYSYRKVKKYGPARRSSRWSKYGSKTTGKSRFKKTAGKVFGVILGIVVVSTLLGTIFLGATLASISASLPNPHELVDRASAQSTKIYDHGGPEDGVLLYTIYGDQNREFVKIEDIPPHVKWAFLAAEDVEFYDHKGLDLPGLVKAGYGYVFKKQTSRGASTISQQLVKNTLLYDILEEQAYEKTVTRKAKEMLITMQLEQSFTKDEILQMYFNEVALGGTNYGIQAAAKAYFGKDAKDLTLAESAMLAGLIQSPGIYSPLFGSNPELSEDRQEYVFSQLEAKADIINKTSKRIGDDFELTDEVLEEARAEEIEYSPARIDIKAPHFVFYVKQQLIEEFGIDRVERGGLIVTTSLDYDLQRIAEEEIKAGVDRFRGSYNVNNGSMVVIDPKTGQVLALVGSYNYWAKPDPKVDGNVNIATSLRQMGSSVKPYTYLTAFHQGYSPALLTPDLPFNFGYEAKNWDGKYRGLMLARQALVESRNIPALYTMQLIGGPDEFIKTAERLGITTLTDRDRYGLSLTLGAGEMKLIEHTSAFGTIANGGVKNPISPVLKVDTYDGETLDEWDPDDAKRVWDEKEIYLLNWVLCDLGGQGRIFSNEYVVGDQRLCGKTGTTDGPRDLTTVLYYPNLVVGVWTGNNNNDVTIGAAGQGWSTTVPLPIANSFMSRVIGKFGKSWYTRPAGIVSGAVCSDTGLRATEETKCNKVSSVFIQGKLPPIDDSRVKKPICKETGKIATNADIAEALGLIEYKTFLEINLEVEQHQARFNSWLEKNSSYGSMTKIPDEAECPLDLGPGNAPLIEFTSPANGASFKRGDRVTFKVNARGIDIAQVEYFLDGVSIGMNSNDPYSKQYAIPTSTSIGQHTISAVVTDDEGRSGSDSILITVTDPSLSIGILVTQPGNGDTINLPYNVAASITGDSSIVTGVEFRLLDQSNPTAPPEQYSGINSGGSVWSTNLPASISDGTYWLYAVASTNDGKSYTSDPWITVTIN